jgi:hypothetical protein
MRCDLIQQQDWRGIALRRYKRRMRKDEGKQQCLLLSCGTLLRDLP